MLVSVETHGRAVGAHCRLWIRGEGKTCWPIRSERVGQVLLPCTRCGRAQLRMRACAGTRRRTPHALAQREAGIRSTSVCGGEATHEEPNAGDGAAASVASHSPPLSLYRMRVSPPRSRQPIAPAGIYTGD